MAEPAPVAQTALVPHLDLEIALPPSWADLTQSPATGLDRLLAADPRLVRHRGAVADQIQVSTARAWETDAALAALGAATDNGAVVLAVVTAHLLEAPDAEDRHGVDGMAGLVLAVRNQLGLVDRDQPDDLSVSSFPPVAPEPLATIELPAGPAVRARFLEEEGDGRRTTVVEHVRYLLPVAGTDVVVMLDFSTPAVSVADELAHTFHAMAETLRILMPT